MIYIIAIVIFVTLWYFGKKKKLSQIKYIITASINSDKEIEMLNLVNEYRGNKIEIDGYATQLAKQHNFEMIGKNEISHFDFNKRSNLLMEKGALNVGEILAYGYNSNEGALTGFKKSKSHNKTLLGNYSHVGISIVDGYYTLIFINT